MSYTTLCNWLETGAAGTINRSTAERLRSYSAIFDQLAAIDGHKPALGLEYHHDSKDRVDIGLEGGFELFELEEIRYPAWLQAMAKYLKQKAVSSNPEEDTFCIEFDKDSEGFRLAGFFKRLGSQADDGDTTSDSAAERYLELFDKFRGCHSRSSKRLAGFLREIGHPDWVGIMARGGNVVKLIATLHQQNCERTKAFCSDNFGKSFEASGVDLERIFMELKDCLPQSRLRVSLDIDLDSDIILPRFSLEMSPRSKGREAKTWPETTRQLMDLLQVGKSQVTDFQKVFNLLPRGVKRPAAFISGDLESLHCSYYHLKASTTPRGSSIKSYVGAHYQKQEEKHK